MTRRFTGRHMLAWMFGFFGVVIAVNVTMATLAETTFGGTVVDNSYVASQHFNTWLAEARAQERLGWKAQATTADRRVLVTAEDHGQALAGATVDAVAIHPLGRLPEVPLRFRESAPGAYVADTRLPAGRWRLHLSLVRAGRRADLIQDVTA